MDNQISKKDLLLETGISYGQLYRWKRMGLIPEEWFVRKSTFTGTETFFPRERVLARIEKIQSMKGGDLSLEEIADVVAPPLASIALTPAELLDRRIASKSTLEMYATDHPSDKPYALGDVLTLHVLERLLREGTVTADEGQTLIATMSSGLASESEGEFEALLIRKAGLSLWLLAPLGCTPRFEESARVVARIDLGARLEELKSLLAADERTAR